MSQNWIDFLFVLGGTIVLGLFMLWSFAYAMGAAIGSVAAHTQPKEGGEIIDIPAESVRHISGKGRA